MFGSARNAASLAPEMATAFSDLNARCVSTTSTYFSSGGSGSRSGSAARGWWRARSTRGLRGDRRTAPAMRGEAVGQEATRLQAEVLDAAERRRHADQGLVGAVRAAHRPDEVRGEGDEVQPREVQLRDRVDGRLLLERGDAQHQLRVQPSEVLEALHQLVGFTARFVHHALGPNAYSRRNGRAGPTSSPFFRSSDWYFFSCAGVRFFVSESCTKSPRFSFFRARRRRAHGASRRRAVPTTRRAAPVRSCTRFSAAPSTRPRPWPSTTPGSDRSPGAHRSP